MELELKHIAPYLPYGINVKTRVNTRFSKIIIEKITGTDLDQLGIFKIYKPILRPLSDLEKEIEHGERFVPILKLKELFLDNTLNYGLSIWGWVGFWNDYNQIPMFLTGEIMPECHYGIFEFLLEYHFDVFGLIEKGLAIDINTLEK